MTKKEIKRYELKNETSEIYNNRGGFGSLTAEEIFSLCGEDMNREPETIATFNTEEEGLDALENNRKYASTRELSCSTGWFLKVEFFYLEEVTYLLPDDYDPEEDDLEDFFENADTVDYAVEPYGIDEEDEEDEEEPSYLFATIPAEDAARLTEAAKGFDDVEAFIQHVEYECWMDDFTDSPEGEPMTEAECDAINEALREVWEEAHPAKDELPEDYAERWELANILTSSPAWDGLKNPKELALHCETEELKDLVKMLDKAENEYYEEGGDSIPLYRLRKDAGLTQAALAEKTGLLKTQISKYERGAASPANMQLGTAAKLAKALGCHAEDLLGKEEGEK